MKNYNEYKKILAQPLDSSESKKEHYLTKEKLAKNLDYFNIEEINDLYNSFPKSRKFFFNDLTFKLITDKAIKEGVIFEGHIPKKTKGINFAEYFKLIDIKKNKNLIENYIMDGNADIQECVARKCIEEKVKSDFQLELSDKSVVDYIIHLDQIKAYEEIDKYLVIYRALNALMGNYVNTNEFSDKLKDMIIAQRNHYLFNFNFSHDEIIEKLDKIEITPDMLSYTQDTEYEEIVINKYISQFDFSQESGIEKFTSNTTQNIHSAVWQNLVNNKSKEVIKRILCSPALIKIDMNQTEDYDKIQCYDCNYMQFFFTHIADEARKKTFLADYEYLLHEPILKNVKSLKFKRNYLELMFELNRYDVFNSLTMPQEQIDLQIAVAFELMKSAKNKLNNWSFELILQLPPTIIDNYLKDTTYLNQLPEENIDFLRLIKEKGRINDLIAPVAESKNSLLKI